MKYQNNKAGFTLVELLVSVAILGLLAVIGIPKYLGYVDTSKTAVVKNNLRAIYLQQQEYLQRNNTYYVSGASCSNYTANINTNLFSGKTILTSNEGFYYCITQSTATDFTATAQDTATSARYFTINHLNVTNF